MTHTTTQLLKVKQVAERLNVTPQTVYIWMDNGTLPYVTVGRTRRILEEDLEIIIKANRVERQKN